MIIRVINKILKIFAIKLIRSGTIWPFVYIFSNVIKEVKPSVSTHSAKKLTILALNPDRFRGDLQILADSGNFRILKVPFEWQCRILALFWPKNFVFNRVEYCNPDAKSEIALIQKNLRSFLKRFLLVLYSRLQVDCVISAAIHYKQDYDWGAVSNEIGTPYIVLHRENLVTAPKLREAFLQRGRELYRFNGSYLIVHNQIIKDIFIQSKCVDPDKISALGALRMDEFIRKTRKVTMNHFPRKRVVLFSFHHGTGLLGIFSGNAWSEDRNEGFVRLFDDVHVAIAELAMENPDVDFVIKPKWGGDWPRRIECQLQVNDIDIKKISNLTIIVDVDVHELILSADVVIGFGSTTLLEAAIARKPIIYPLFDEALKPEYTDYIQFKDDLEIFDVARSFEAFKILTAKRLHNPIIDKQCLKKRYIVFEKYVSSMQANALDKYTETITRVIRSKHQI